jgi:hypothetical protein
MLKPTDQMGQAAIDIVFSAASRVDHDTGEQLAKASKNQHSFSSPKSASGYTTAKGYTGFYIVMAIHVMQRVIGVVLDRREDIE